MRDELSVRPYEAECVLCAVCSVMCDVCCAFARMRLDMCCVLCALCLLV
jgi:hypothetical protein